MLPVLYRGTRVWLGPNTQKAEAERSGVQGRLWLATEQVGDQPGIHETLSQTN